MVCRRKGTYRRRHYDGIRFGGMARQVPGILWSQDESIRATSSRQVHNYLFHIFECVLTVHCNCRPAYKKVSHWVFIQPAC